MASATIDYDKLAAQHGGTVAIDYDALAAQHGGTVAASEAASAPQEGFLHSLGSSLGITPEAARDRRDHPIRYALQDAILGPAGDVAKSLYEQGRQSFNALRQAGADYKGGNTPQAAVDAIQAVPIVGPAMVKATDQYAAGNKTGEFGTLLGASAQVAPVVLGAADAAGVPRPNSSLANMIPTRAAAGEIFNKLNTKLADQPVQLNASAAPLQRATEIAARGGTMPAPVNALLQRSQAIEPMTFPEARDYQASLSDLSASDKLAMNGRMKGAVAQLSHALYQDLRNSAEAGGNLGADYDKAMTQYRQASQIRNAAQVTGKAVAKAAGAAALGAGGYALVKDVTAGK